MISLTLVAMAAAIAITTYDQDGGGATVVRVRPIDAPSTTQDHDIRLDTSVDVPRATPTPAPHTPSMALATPQLLAAIGAVVETDRCTLPIGTPLSIDARRRDAIARMGVQLDGDIATAMMRYVIGEDGITNDGKQPAFLPIEELGTPIVCVSTSSGKFSSPRSRRWPMIVLDEYVGAVANGTPSIVDGLPDAIRTDPARLYDVLIPVRIDVPQLDDAHDPVCWFLPNARTIRLLRTAGVSFTTGIDQGAVTNAAAIGVVPNPAFRECTLVMRGVSSGSMRVRVTSIDGKEMLSVDQEIDEAMDELSVELEIDDLPSGVYVISVTSNGRAIATTRLMRR